MVLPPNNQMATVALGAGSSRQHTTCTCSDVIDLTDLGDANENANLSHAANLDSSNVAKSNGQTWQTAAVAGQQDWTKSSQQHQGFAHGQAQQTSADGWPCKFCTLVNDARDSNCMACEQWRYARPLPAPVL